MRNFLLAIILSVSLPAFDTATASKIYEKIFGAMFKQHNIAVYSVSKEYRDVIRVAPSLTLASDPKHADILLIDKASDVPKWCKNIIFTTNPSIFEKYENAVGAFYWEHGRPKIIFLKSRLDAKGIKLSKDFERYIISEIP